MLTIFIIIFLGLNQYAQCQNWSINASAIQPWESYLQLGLGEIQRPLGLSLTLNNVAHYHFYVGYLALHSFMYDTAREAFNLAINTTSSFFIEAYIGKMLGCKQPLWSFTDIACAKAIYSSIPNSLPTTPLQRDLLSTVYSWFLNDTYIAGGENNFLIGIRNLSVQYPNDTDIQVLYGLSLLNVADQVEFQNMTQPPKMVEARSVLKAAFDKEPNHPGASHLLIHAYDVPLVNIAEEGRPYAIAYGNLVKTSSHGQHMPAHIWIRVGDWRLAVNADRTAILVSYTMCLIKARNQLMNTTSSIELSSIPNPFPQNVTFLRCDDENRAHSMEWLAYTVLQTGDWTTCFGLIRDLYMSYNNTSPTLHYLPFAYRSHARTIIELFYWFPYKSQFFNRTNQLRTLFDVQSISVVSSNETSWYRMWSEAGLKLSESLRILSGGNLTLTELSRINDYLNRLSQLSNMSRPLNQYVSGSIGLMLYHIRGIQAYVNGLWQECLTQLSEAVEREKQVIPDANSPTLGFARSAELLALHLLLIYDKAMGSTKTTKVSVSSAYVLNNQTIPIQNFPSQALSLYQTTNSTAPNRAINTLGMIQANVDLGNRDEVKRLENLLKSQLSLSNTTDNSFLQEVQNSVNQLVSKASSKSSYQTLLTIISIFFVLYIFLSE